ncbi:MAG: type II toxin-antitoxin system Phd/YefM family antitoxin [Actinomycetota bacterium]
MERFVGIEEARGKLGALAEEVSAGSEPVILSKRGQALAVLVSRDEYSRLKTAATRLVRAELSERLVRVRERAKQAKLTDADIEEAIAAARSLD